MVKNSHIFLLAMVIVLIACNAKQVLGPHEYMEWVASKDALINNQKEIGNYTIAIKYLPQDYLALKEFEKPYTNIDEKQFNEARKKFDGHYYFLLRIVDEKNDKSVLRSDINGYGEYADRLNYFAFEAQEDFKLIEGKDTLDCVLHHFENNYNLSPINDITVVFKKNAENQDLTFLWKDKTLGLGTVKFFMEKSDLEEIPTLNIN